jgi:hypothetical protein
MKSNARVSLAVPAPVFGLGRAFLCLRRRVVCRDAGTSLGPLMGGLRRVIIVITVSCTSGSIPPLLTMHHV